VVTPAPARRGALDWLSLAALVVCAILLALVELFFLPLRFDGDLLPNWGAVPFPITALLAAVTTPWLILRAGAVSTRILVAGAPMWAWLATLAIVGTVGIENMVLLNDWRTLLLAAAVLPGAVALGTILARRATETRPPPPDAEKPARGPDSSNRGRRSADRAGA
jgi:hypothetical protein